MSSCTLAPLPGLREGGGGWVPFFRFKIIGYRQNLCVGAKLPVRTRRRNEIFSETIDKSRLLLYNNTVNRFTCPHKLKNMKKKELITIIIIVIVLAAILFGAIYLANRHRYREGKFYTPSIIGEGSQAMGKYLYFVKGGTLMRYDSVADSVTKLCGHTEDNDDCLLERIGSSGIQLYGNRFYFAYNTEILGEEGSVAYYDIGSGNTKKIDVEINITNYFFVYDGYIYYIDIDFENICRIPADGGKPEKLIKCEGIKEMFMVADGKIYVSRVLFSLSSSVPAVNIGYIYSYDIKTLEKKEVFIFNTTTIYPVGKALYFDEKIYLQISEVSRIPTSSVSTERFIKEYLYRIDTKTNEILLLSETGVNHFYLTEESLYYIPYEERKVYAPDVYFADENGMYETLSSADIHACNLDGGNDRIIYTNSYITLYSAHIINGKLFGLFIGTVSGIEGNDFYASLNLESGEIKKIIIPE